MSRGAYAGLRGYARLYASLLAEPTTIRGLMQRHGIGKTGAYAFVLGLHKLGRVRIIDWQAQPAWRCWPHPVFAVGPGPDTPFDALAPGGKPSKRSTFASKSGKLSPTLVAFEYMLRAMDEGHASVDDLAEASGCSEISVLRFLRAAIPLGICRISAWDKESNFVMARYSLGAGKPAPRPAKLSRSAINARCWNKRLERNRAIELSTIWRQAA